MEIINKMFEELCYKEEQRNRIVAGGRCRVKDFGLGLKFQYVLILFGIVQ